MLGCLNSFLDLQVATCVTCGSHVKGLQIQFLQNGSEVRLHFLSTNLHWIEVLVVWNERCLSWLCRKFAMKKSRFSVLTFHIFLSSNQNLFSNDFLRCSERVENPNGSKKVRHNFWNGRETLIENYTCILNVSDDDAEAIGSQRSMLCMPAPLVNATRQVAALDSVAQIR